MCIQGTLEYICEGDVQDLQSKYRAPVLKPVMRQIENSDAFDIKQSSHMCTWMNLRHEKTKIQASKIL